MGLRICGLTIVRDEEDIVEASIRHNLGALDALTVVDHGSDDGTSAIVEALRAELHLGHAALPQRQQRRRGDEIRPGLDDQSHIAVRRLLVAR